MNQMLIFISPPFVMIMSIYTVKIIETQNQKGLYEFVRGSSDMRYTFLVFLPAYLVYLIFCRYAFITPIAKCSQNEYLGYPDFVR